ncbi:hypothetical protein [Lactobacillus panisapium]|uniref:Uncharacterized protein n=1 Tax=Lactobacillus panisapium TaxID=2012495 RepID=A0ABX8W428_9LACO|nr:hypothetical protein [Lactobacillus panisapium]QYN52480.1 hypothetical protein GYM71_03295 [Lactobacillus panisapium]
MNEKNKYLDELKELNSIRDSTTLVKKSFLYLLPKKGKNFKKQCIKLVIITVFSIFIVYFISQSGYQITKLKNVISLINNIDLVLLGIIFTGFSVFQVLMNHDVTKMLISYDNSKSRSFVELNKSYYYLMTDYGLNIFINYVLLLILNVIPKSWINFAVLHAVCCLSVFLVFYLVTSCLIIYELKYFLFNLYSVYVLRSSVDFCKNDEEDS